MAGSAGLSLKEVVLAVFKQGTKQGLYEAFSLGIVWFEHEMKK